MARTAVNGAVLAIASAYGTAFNFTAATNATECVVTAAVGHGIIVGDIVEVVTSGWQRAEARIFRVSVVATNNLTLEGFNTTSATLFPTGSGAGTMRQINTWQNVSQVINISQSGGEQQFLSYQYLDQDIQSQIPTTRNPTALQLELHDDITQAFYATITAAQQSQSLTAFRITARDGKKWFGNAYLSLAGFPTMEANNVLRRTLDMALVGDPPATSYST